MDNPINKKKPVMNNNKNIHCPHFIPCSGCTIDENVDHPPVLNEITQFFNEHLTPFEYFSDKVIGWRDRAKLAVRGSYENPQIGLYEAGSHHVVDIPLCRVHHPSINLAAKHVKTWILKEKIIPYDEFLQKGLLRYIQCVVERATGRIQLSLVINDLNQDKLVSKLSALWDAAPQLWHSLWINFNVQRTNAIFGKEWSLVHGKEYIEETLADTQVCFHPANFAQANLEVFEHLLWDLKRQIKPDQRIVEYYAGVGVIGLCLAKIGQKVYCCEINPFAKFSFEKAHSLQKASRITFFTGSARTIQIYWEKRMW